MYKLISKVLTNRLKPHMHSLISKNQNASIPGRLITNNKMIAHELLHSIKGKSKGRNEIMAIKLDMVKAYDKVKWGYLETTLNTLGFNNHWRKLIMYCFSIVSYSILLTGRRGQAFKPSRSLQQGYSLSPYLFLLCTEDFNIMINAAE